MSSSFIGGGAVPAWPARFRRLARDYERLPSSLAAYHWLAFVSLMLANLFPKGS